MNNYIRDLLSFLDASPTSVQASQQIVKRLEERGFAALDEGKKMEAETRHEILSATRNQCGGTGDRQPAPG